MFFAENYYYCVDDGILASCQDRSSLTAASARAHLPPLRGPSPICAPTPELKAPAPTARRFRVVEEGDARS
jgi:hypothetical protein